MLIYFFIKENIYVLCWGYKLMLKGLFSICKDLSLVLVVEKII